MSEIKTVDELNSHISKYICEEFRTQDAWKLTTNHVENIHKSNLTEPSPKMNNSKLRHETSNKRKDKTNEYYKKLLDDLKQKIEHRGTTALAEFKFDDCKSLNFNPSDDGDWENYCKEFKNVTSKFNSLSSRANKFGCELVFEYGGILTNMFEKYKLMKTTNTTWIEWFGKFVRENDITLSTRQESRYRRFYTFVKQYPFLKRTGLSFKDLDMMMNDIRLALFKFPEYIQHFCVKTGPITIDTHENSMMDV